MDIISNVLRQYRNKDILSKDFETKLRHNLLQVFVNSSAKSINDAIEAVMERNKNIKEGYDIKFPEVRSQHNQDLSNYYRAFRNCILTCFKNENDKVELNKCEEIVIAKFSRNYEKYIKCISLMMNVHKKVLRLAEENNLPSYFNKLEEAIYFDEMRIELAKRGYSSFTITKEKVINMIDNFKSEEEECGFVKVIATKTRRISQIIKLDTSYSFNVSEFEDKYKISSILIILKCMSYEIVCIETSKVILQEYQTRFNKYYFDKQFDEKQIENDKTKRINYFGRVYDKEIREISKVSASYKKDVSILCNYLGQKFVGVKNKEISNNDELTKIMISLLRNGYNLPFDQVIDKVIEYVTKLTKIDNSQINDVFQTKKRIKILETSMLLDEYVFFNIESQKEEINFFEIYTLFECLGFEVSYENDKNKRRCVSLN